MNDIIRDTVLAVIIEQCGQRRCLSVTAIRQAVAQVEDIDPTHNEVSQALIALAGQHIIRFIPELNQKTITPQLQRDAVWMGMEWRHFATVA